MTTAMLVQGFSRSQTIELTGIGIDRLNYLDKNQIVVPYRHGINKRPLLFYSWLQVIQLKLLEAINKQVSTEVAIASINRIEDVITNLSLLKDRDIVVVNSQPYWIERGWTVEQLLELIERERRNNLHNGMSKEQIEAMQYTQMVSTRYMPVGFTYSVKSCVQQIVEAAKNSEIVDFEEFKQLTNYDSFKDALDLE